jgi:hypothetical protein
VLFQGDLGFRGRTETIRAGAAYMKELLDQNGIDRPRFRTLVGNHDVRWEAGDEKYRVIQEEWDLTERGSPPLHLVGESLEFRGCGLHLCSANSSQLGLKMTREIKRLSSVVTDGGESDLSDRPRARSRSASLMRRLKPGRRQPEFADFPSINPSEIADHLSYDRFRETVGGLLVFQAHHGIVPQEVSRVRIAAPELLQAGLIRQRLLGLDRPTLYLHGHTHVRAVHTLVDRTRPHSMLVSVGCGEFPLAFNIIEIFFDEDHPLGVVVRSFEQEKHAAGIRELEPVHCPLIVSGDRHRFVTDQDRELLVELLNREVRLSEIAEDDCRVDLLKEQVGRLEALGLVRVDRSTGSARGWILTWNG